jgi:hypothetical protein
MKSEISSKWYFILILTLLAIETIGNIYGLFNAVYRKVYPSIVEFAFMLILIYTIFIMLINHNSRLKALIIIFSSYKILYSTFNLFTKFDVFSKYAKIDTVIFIIAYILILVFSNSKILIVHKKNIDGPTSH